MTLSSHCVIPTASGAWKIDYSEVIYHNGSESTHTGYARMPNGYIGTPTIIDQVIATGGTTRPTSSTTSCSWRRSTAT